MNQLTAQTELEKMGKKAQTVLTWEQAKQEGAFIKKGAQSFVLTGYDKDAGEGVALCFGCPSRIASCNQKVLDRFGVAEVQGSLHEEHNGHGSQNKEGGICSRA